METDYKNYDRLFVTVKLNKLEEPEKCYDALGWECVEKKTVRGGRVQINYRRPHRVENKDELQLLQVYLEAALNEEGKMDSRSMPHTAAVGIITGFLTVALVVLGLCLMFLTDNPVYFVAGIVFLSCAAAMFLLAVTATLKVFFKEREKRKARLLKARAEIAAALRKVEAINGSREAIKEAAEEAAVSCSEGGGER